jgi:hypothetical protein
LLGLLFLDARSAGAVVLYDQTDSPGESNAVSQDFEASQNALDSTAADDFTVPSGESWEIDGADVLGDYNGPGPAASSRVTFQLSPTQI